MQKVLFPIFVSLFLDMVQREFLAEGQDFFKQFAGEFQMNHAGELKKLADVNSKAKLQDPEIQSYLTTKFLIKMSQFSYSLLDYSAKLN